MSTEETRNELEEDAIADLELAGEDADKVVGGLPKIDGESADSKHGD